MFQSFHRRRKKKEAQCGETEKKIKENLKRVSK